MENITLAPIIHSEGNGLPNIVTVKVEVSNSCDDQNLAQSIVCTKQGATELEYTVYIKEENKRGHSVTPTNTVVPPYFDDDHDYYSRFCAPGEAHELADCDKCGLRFSFKSDLEEHLKIHRQEVFFPCPKCNRRFTTYQGLLLHQETHSGARNYVCTVCGKRYTQNVLLNRHLNTHATVRTTNKKTGNPPPESGSGVAQRAELVVYKKSSDGKRLYGCAVCGKSFFRQYCLLNHRKTHKNGEHSRTSQVPQV